MSAFITNQTKYDSTHWELEYVMEIKMFIYFKVQTNFTSLSCRVKGILWDRWWIAPSIGIFSHTCGFFFYRNAFLLMHETKQSSKFQSDPSPNRQLLHNRHLKYKLLINSLFLIFLIAFLYRIIRHFTGVLQCFEMWYFGNRFVLGTIFI